MSQILSGRHAVFHAVQAGRRKIERVLLSQNLSEIEKNEILSLLKEKKIRYEIKEATALSKISPTEKHQGFLATVSDYSYSSLDEILAAAKGKKNGFVLVLDEIQDPQHLGALIRSASCFGAIGVVIPEGGGSQIGPAASKASSGAIEYMKVARISSIAKGLALLKEAGFWVFGAEAGVQASLYSQDFKLLVALVIGSEGRGMRPLVRKTCDFLVSIPLQGPIPSLSASAAGAIVMAEIGRQQSSGN